MTCAGLLERLTLAEALAVRGESTSLRGAVWQPLLRGRRLALLAHHPKEGLHD